MGLEGVFIDVDLEDLEDAWLFGALVGLVVDIARFGAGGRGKLLKSGADGVLLAGVGDPGCAADKCRDDGPFTDVFVVFQVVEAGS